MIRLLAGILFLGTLSPTSTFAQEAAPQKLTAKSEQKGGEKEKPAKAPASITGPTDQPVTTDITADEAFFDSAKNIGIFTGHVVVTDPRFNIQSDKLTAYIAKGEDGGLERAVAEGNVGVVRDRPDPKGGSPTRSVGRGEKAVYTSKDGNMELTGSPRVQQGLNLHIATSPDTLMILNEKGQLTTRGPSRTEIRQQPKGEEPKQ